MGQWQQSPQVGRDGHVGPVKECQDLGGPPQPSPPPSSLLSFTALSVHEAAPLAYHKVGMRTTGGHKCKRCHSRRSIDASSLLHTPVSPHLPPQGHSGPKLSAHDNVKWGKNWHVNLCPWHICYFIKI